MTVDGEDRAVSPGDLVYIYINIPPDRVHSLRPVGGGAIYCFWFVVDYMPHVCKGWTARRCRGIGPDSGAVRDHRP
jgi:hypothetical protein